MKWIKYSLITIALFLGMIYFFIHAPPRTTAWIIFWGDDYSKLIAEFDDIEKCGSRFENDEHQQQVCFQLAELAHK